MADKVVLASSTSELIEQKAIAGLDEIQTWVESGKEFVMEQAPLVVHEMIYWGLGKCFFWMILSICVILFCVWLYYFGKKTSDDAEKKDSANRFLIEDREQREFQFGFGVCIRTLSVIKVFIWCIVISYNVYGAIFIWFAPRLFILDELATLAAKFAGKH